MIFTVEQAPRILCPSRSATKPTPCCAAKCASWRWLTATGAHGFCGLSGQPERYRDQTGKLWMRESHGELVPVQTGAADDEF
jgi:hypothetical protein